jgi:hypothetical protein
VADAQALPDVARVYTAPGIVVDRVDKTISISGFMELSGPEATPARALKIQESINSTWTKAFPDGYSVTCNVKVTFRGPGRSPGRVAQIEAIRCAEPSGVSDDDDRSMTINANEPDAFTWTPAHEFGHVIGLEDGYSEGIMSELRARWGGTRIVTLKPGYKGNLMGETNGKLAKRNLVDLGQANAPAWLDEDDQVRAWVKGHSLFEIRQLSTPHKLAAIKTLLDGWISSDDLLAIRRICGCAASKPEADAIRGSIDLSSMTDLGQRMQMRVILSNMPY